MRVKKFVRDLIAEANYLPNRRLATAPPDISVIMPVYRDRANGLTRRAIESVLSQSLTNIELIIIDDGSNDGLFDVLQQYHRSDDRVSIIRHQVNSGLPALRVNEGLLAAKAPLVAYQFEDDFWYDNALASLHSGIPSDSQYFVVYGNVVRVSSSGEQIDILGNVPVDRVALLRQNLFANCAVLHPSTLTAQIGMYDPQILLRRLSDHDLWLRATRVADFIHVPKTIGESTVAHENSLGRGVHLDREITLPLVGIDKSKHLTPTQFKDYDVVLPFPPANQLIEAAIWRETIAPFAALHPEIFSRDDRSAIAAKTSADYNNAIIKSAYSTSIDVTFGNFVHSVCEQEQFFTFYSEAHLPNTLYLDRAIIYRTVSPATTAFIARCRAREVSIVYVMDDNMFAFHEVGPEHAYLGPGTPNHKAMCEQVEAADFVMVYSEEVERACRKLNPRVLRLETNIRACRVTPSSNRLQKERRKVALITSPIREAELKVFWTEIKNALEGTEDVELHCWGFDCSSFENFNDRIIQRDFDHSYERYIDRLKTENFEIIIAPLFDDSTVKRSKSPIKYLEAAAAGALLLVSDVAVYGTIRNGVTAIKIQNKTGAWGDALAKALAMPSDQRNDIVGRAQEDVADRFTSEKAAVDVATALIAADFHNLVRSRNSPSGKPSVLYIFGHTPLGGATLHLLDHARLMASLGVRPIICTRSNDRVDSKFRDRVVAEGWKLISLPYSVSLAPEALQVSSIAQVDILTASCRSLDIRAIHATPYSADWASAAEKLEIPLILSLHQAYNVPNAQTTFGRPHGVHCSSQRYATIWSSSFACPTHAFPAPVSTEHFSIGDARIRAGRPLWNNRITVLVSGTLQPRKGQLRAAAAVASLIEDGFDLELVLAGYTEWFPEYAEACKSEFERRRLENRLTIHGFVDDMRPLYAAADIVLCSSEDESQPQAILFGMASGCLAISAPAGGVREMIKDGFNGFIARGSSSGALKEAIARALSTSEEEREQIIRNGIEASWTRSHPRFTRLRLVELYVAACRESAMRKLQVAKPTESRLVEVTLTGEFGKRLYFYGFIIDGKPVEVPQSTLSGWSSHANTVGKFLLKNENTTSVFTTRIDLIHRLQIKILATAESGAFQVEVGELKTSFNAYSTVAGGAFRTFDVPLPAIRDNIGAFVWPFEGLRAVREALRGSAQDDIANAKVSGEMIVVNGVCRDLRRVSVAVNGRIFGAFVPLASDNDGPIVWTIAFPIADLQAGQNLLLPVGRTETGLEQIGVPILIGKAADYDAITLEDLIGQQVPILPSIDLYQEPLGLLDVYEVGNESITLEGWCRPIVNGMRVNVVIVNDGFIVGVTSPWFERPGLAEAIGDPEAQFAGWRTTCAVQNPGHVVIGVSLEFPPREVYLIGEAYSYPLTPVTGERNSASWKHDADEAASSTAAKDFEQGLPGTVGDSV